MFPPAAARLNSTGKLLHFPHRKVYLSDTALAGALYIYIYIYYIMKESVYVIVCRKKAK